MDVRMLKKGMASLKIVFIAQSSNIVTGCKKSIFFIQVIGGCDITFATHGKGKLEAVQLIKHNTYLQHISDVFNNSNFYV